MNKLVILYVEEDGGDYRSLRGVDDDDTQRLFDDTVKQKRLLYQIGSRIINIRPVFIGIYTMKKNHDFVLGMSQEAFAAKQAAEEKEEKEHNEEA